MMPPLPSQPFRVAALYRFCRLDAFAALKPELAPFCRARGIRGTLILAGEGINGTVAGSGEAIAALVARLEAVPELAGLEVKYSEAAEMPFHRMKVRLKREIVTMGVDGIDPERCAGTYVAPADWNALISEPGTLVVDTRNDYEVSLGSFRGALDPRTKSCEKATAYARALGIDEVFHLKGGILKYLEEVPRAESLWEGECFVFDERVSVSHGLEEGEAELCRACRRPLTPADRGAPEYVAGVSCAHCHGARSEADRARYAERQRQVELAGRRGAGPHIGG